MEMQISVTYLVKLRSGRTAEHQVVIVLVASEINGVDRRRKFHINGQTARSDASQRHAQIGIRTDNRFAYRRPDLVDGLPVRPLNLRPMFRNFRLFVKLAHEIRKTDDSPRVGRHKLLARDRLERGRIGNETANEIYFASCASSV